MSPREVLAGCALGVVVLSCWVGAVGMWRMREPMQALHFLAVPACLGSAALVAAVFLQTGNTQAAWKTVLICLILFAFNSVVTHATSRAFRTRDAGHWQPRPGDAVERVHAGRADA